MCLRSVLHTYVLRAISALLQIRKLTYETVEWLRWMAPDWRVVVVPVSHVSSPWWYTLKVTMALVFFYPTSLDERWSCLDPGFDQDNGWCQLFDSDKKISLVAPRANTSTRAFFSLFCLRLTYFVDSRVKFFFISNLRFGNYINETFFFFFSIIRDALFMLSGCTCIS